MPRNGTSLFRAAAVLLRATVSLTLSWTLLGCSNETCRGVEVNGVCQEPCVPSRCGGDQTCVDDRCAALCDDTEDCEPGLVCREQEADDGESVRVCLNAPDVSGEECNRNEQCEEARGERCVDGFCRLTCRTHAHCGSAGSCSEAASDIEGNDVALCRSDEFPRDDGEFESSCFAGNSDCAGDFRCISAGEGDADSYCTSVGCEDDEECPTGYYCSTQTLLADNPCENACGLSGVPTDPNCVPGERIGDGQPFRCGPLGLELHLCLKREYCNECETDADCRGIPDQICARGIDGEKTCTVRCDPSTNSCPWGSASDCEVWDEDVGEPTCAHRAGSCRQDGDSCDPCIDDRDCPRGICAANSFTGEQFCIDLEVTCSCALGAQSCQGGGCPETPSGLSMTCVPRTEGAPPEVCFGAYTVQTDSTSPLGCWPR